MIYLDHSATTPMSNGVLQSMQPFFIQEFGNASSLHHLGRKAKEAMENARKSIANCIGANPDEIYFTSGGTESNNWVLKTCCSGMKNHIITTAIEHPAILECCKFLEAQGCRVTYLPVNHIGQVQIEDIEAAITPQTALVSVMAVNNEVGVLEPIEEIASLCFRQKIPFHSDAVQALENLSFNVHEQKINYLTLSGHKIYGPKGIGLLYMEKKHTLPPLIHGGGQEMGRRSGTEGIAQIVGFARAIIECKNDAKKKRSHFSKLRNQLIQGLSDLPITINSDEAHYVPNIISITMDELNSEALLHLLSLKGICISAGSACHSKKEEPSHVLLAMGMSLKKTRSTIRISLGQENTEAEIIRTIEVIRECFGLMK